MNRWSVTGPQAKSAGSRDSQHARRDGMPQQYQLGQSWAATTTIMINDGDRARWDKFIGYFEGSEEGNKHAVGTMHYSSRDERWTNNNN